MAGNASRIVVIHFAVLLSLSACMAKNRPELTHTTSALETIIPTPTKASSTTIANPLEEKETPKPKTLSGTVFLSNIKTEPLVTSIDLRGKDTFWLYKTLITDAEGKFEITDIPPGDYELWVLITTEAKMVSGCENLLVPNNQWRIGIKFQESNPIIIGETSLQEAILGSQNFKAYDLHPTGFYAVSPDFTIVSAFDEEIEITLTCQ